MSATDFNANANMRAFLTERCQDMREHLSALADRDEGYDVTVITDDHKYGIAVTHIGAHNETNVYKAKVLQAGNERQGIQIGLGFKTGLGINLTRADMLPDEFDKVRDMILADLQRSAPERVRSFPQTALKLATRLN